MHPDALAAIILFLKNNAEIDALVDGRIYGLELPQEEIQQMPQKTLLVKRSGSGALDDLALTQWRVDVFCYAETPSEAYALYRTVHPVLKHLSREVSGDVLLHACQSSGGPLDMRDPQTRWPLVWSSWMMSFADVLVSV